MATQSRRRSTKTSSFGTNGRISHDSSTFYAGQLYDGYSKEDPDAEYLENPVPANTLDSVFNGTSERMEQLPDSSVHLMVTSPPYNVGKEYDDNLSLREYRDLLRNVLAETYRVLVPGGRACINIANVGRKPYVPLHSYVIEDALETGFLMRGEIIWDKDDSVGPSTAWGSWASAMNPTLRDTHEYVLVFSKQRFGRPQLAGRDDSIHDEDFLRFTKSVWVIPAESATRVDHPAPFPIELPERLIKLYSFEGDVVLDPFMGSGSTAIAASNMGRHYVGYEIDERYREAALERIHAQEPRQNTSGRQGSLPLFNSSGNLPSRRRDLLPAIVSNEFDNHLSRDVTDATLTAYFDACFDQTVTHLGLSPAWACMGCLNNKVETVRSGLTPERCVVCQSDEVYQVGSFQSRSSQLGKVFQMAVVKIAKDSLGLELTEASTKATRHDLKWKNVLIATRGSARRLLLPDGSEQIMAGAGMNRSDTMKKASRDAQIAKASDRSSQFVVVTNAFREGPAVQPTGDIDWIINVSTTVGLKRLATVLS